MAKPRIMIFLGAGASFGCGGVSPFSPPLGNNLFIQLKNKFPKTWGTLSREKENIFTQNFELGMETTLNDWVLRDRLLKDMAIFFSRFDISNSLENLYSRFISDFFNFLLSRDIIVSTINYDCLFELSSLYYGYPIAYWNDDVGIKLIKIHGSCNFFPAGITGGGTMIIPTGAHTHGPIQIIHPHDVEEKMKNSPAPPCMCLYIKNKDIITSEDQILELQKEFQENILNTDIIFIVGVKPNPEDHHIWDYLAKTNATIFYIGGETDFNAWKIKFRNNLSSYFISHDFHLGYKKIEYIIYDFFSTGKINTNNLLL